jgi:hypothetical protein
MIDLHLHTTASDGLCTPERLVERARQVGITTAGVADHDTMDAVPEVVAAAARYGLTVVPGIEVTSVHEGKDVHVLGYFLEAASPGLMALLGGLRAARVERAFEIGRRLARAGVPIDVEALLRAPQSHGTRSIARPMLARALVGAGHVTSVAEAFDRFLGEDGPAYVPHHGPSPSDAIAAIRSAGGIASLAHPGTLGKDDLIPGLCRAGLDAIEAYHSAHDPETTRRYLAVAREHNLAVSGGSDFHGDGTRRSEHFGVVSLPPDEFDRLSARAELARAKKG